MRRQAVLLWAIRGHNERSGGVAVGNERSDSVAVGDEK